MAAFNLGAMLSAPAVSDENQIKQIPCDLLIPYHNHKFELYSGERLEDMVESIKSNGVLIPIIVQPCNDKYEILIGHNRWNASKLAGKTTVPAIVKTGLNADEAEMYVIESNLMQRGFDNLKISEQAAVIAIRHKAMFSQGKRNDIINELKRLENPNDFIEEGTLSPLDTKLDTNKAVGAEYGMSRATVARLIRIDTLIPELKESVDDRTLSVRAAIEISYTDEQSQSAIAICLKCNNEINMKSAKQLRERFDETGTLTEDDVYGVLLKPESVSQVKSVKISSNIYNKYFTKGYKVSEISNIIEKALQLYFQNETEE